MAEQLMNNPQIMQMLVDQKLRDPQYVSTSTERIRANMEFARPQVAANKNLRPVEFDAALAKLRGVTRLITAYAGAGRLSNKQAISEVRRRYDSVTLDGVIIPSDRLIDEVPEPTEPQLLEHYQKYRDVQPGTGEFGIGYRQPPRVKLEWLMIDSTATSAAIVLDPIAVSKKWQQNRTQFPGEFTAERERVEAELRQVELQRALEEADRVFKAKVRSATRRLVTTGAAKALPADWEQQRPTMESIAAALVESVRSATGVAIPLPTVTIKSAEWLRVSALGELPGIGQAELRLGGRRGGLTQVISETHELAGTSSIGLQAAVPFETPLRDGAGSLYYFTVLEARKESAADSLDEVRAEAVKDMKRLAAFGKLQNEASTYHLLAVSDGLEAVGEMFNKVPAGQTEPAAPLPVFRQTNVSRMQSDQSQPQLADQSFRDQVLALAEAVGPLTVPGADNLAQRTTVAPLPASLSLVVVQITAQKPLTQEDLRTLGKDNYLAIMSRELSEALPGQWPFSFEAVKARLAYRTVRDDDAPEPATTPTSEPAGSAPAPVSPS